MSENPPEKIVPTNREILNSMMSDEYFYSATKEHLVKIFYSHVLREDALHLSFSEIRDKLTSAGWMPLSQIPSTDAGLVDWTCEYFLRIGQAPSEFVADLYRKAACDILEIDARVAKYHAKVNDLRRGSHEEEKEYCARLHEHFIELNKQARAEVFEFMLHGVNAEALRLARKNRMRTPFFWDAGKPYSYKWWASRYDVESTTSLSNKFGHLSVPDFEKIKELYESDRQAFQVKAREYIADFGVRDKIIERLDTHHHLIIRKAIIQQALDAYSAGNYILFVNLIPIQIEGIFRDICIDLRLSALGSLTQKAQLIRKKIDFFPHYEYYAFILPVLRNKIAHGIPINAEELPWIADSLLLDLDDVSEMQVSQEIPINKIISILHQIKTDPNDLRALACFISASDIQIPDFYELHGIALHAREHAEQSKDFLDFLLKQDEWDDPVVTAGLFRIKELIDNQNHKKALNLRLEGRKKGDYVYDVSAFFGSLGVRT